MIEELKGLAAGDLITIDDDRVTAQADSKDHEVTAVRTYSHENGEYVHVELDGFGLAAHSLAGDPRYYFVEEHGGDVGGLDGGELPEKVTLTLNAKRLRYLIAAEGASDGMAAEDDTEISFAAYRGKQPLSALLVELSDEGPRAFLGFRVRESSVLL